ncbi:MAG TPA: Nif3-like dinuclear metal center hexameric protein [Pirellulales bacterium]|nr:Nif3-like dinuclear metal center hexameric protein [Pirellulales bacterium]
MPTLQDICDFLERLAPSDLAEDWDNVGLLVGDRSANASRVMTCLTVTGATVSEAVQEDTDLIVAHHPLPFRPLNRLTTDTPEGRYLLELIAAGIGVFSAHTAFDSARTGINQRLIEGLNVAEVSPLVPAEDDAMTGRGRIGTVTDATTLSEVGSRVKQFLSIDHLRAVGRAEQSVHRVAVACGSAGEFLEPARLAGADILITGETSFHTCLAAEAHGIGLILTGHYASERFAMEFLANELAGEFSGLAAWASQSERDPLNLV